jgi:tRNA dimethylallyltransferase
MTARHFEQTVVLTGPTGSGKSALGLELAERLDAEIIALDSMTLYRGMDVGTAKPSAGDRRRVPHHLIDVLDPWESATVAWWLEQAHRRADEIARRGKRVLYVGGTALYLKALLYGLFDGPPADKVLRRRLEEEAEREGSRVLHDRLAQVDPASARRVHPNDVRRMVRALEVWEKTGRPLSVWQTQWRTLPVSSPQLYWIDLQRAQLYARIDRRVHDMVEQGLVEEARRLRPLPRPLSREAAQAVGYQEIFAHLDGRTTLDEAVAAIQTRTRQFAKRQVTWFRHLAGCQPVPAELTEVLARVTISQGTP